MSMEEDDLQEQLDEMESQLEDEIKHGERRRAVVRFILEDARDELLREDEPPNLSKVANLIMNAIDKLV